MAVQDLDVQEKSDLRPSSHATSDVETGPADEKLQSNNDPNMVNWDTDGDEANPMNWTPSFKWRNLGLISVMSFSTYIPLPFLLLVFFNSRQQLTFPPQSSSILHVCTSRRPSNV